jgi:hypothetical protein
MLFLAGVSLTTSCASYLDVIPDDIATIDHAFATRSTTERFLGTCYSYLPGMSYISNIGFASADEIWGNVDQSNYGGLGGIALGYQNANDPYFNYWDAPSGMWVAIRDCNIFLENINRPTDIEDYERKQWIAEAKFLKAYYHFYLLQMYGPIPLIRENLPINSEVDEVRVYREPVDDVVDYIVELLDEAIPDLLLNTEATRLVDAGRITQPIAAAIKAKALVLAASPLFNGSDDAPPEFSLIDNRGVELFPREYKPEKWTRAAEAVRKAIDISHEAGHGLYRTYIPPNRSAVSDTTQHKFELRAAITEKFNPEIIWPSTYGVIEFQENLMPIFGVFGTNGLSNLSQCGPTLKIAEQFYSRNGVPIDEDREWRNWVGSNFNQRYEPALISIEPGSGINGQSSLSEDHKYDIGTYITSTFADNTHGRVGTSGTVESTAKLHFYREPRFYAWVGFDRGIWEMGRKPDTDSYVLKTKASEDQGLNDNLRHMTCGYFAKKLIHLETDRNSSSVLSISTNFTFPLIRLSDLYLLYAEALNESKQTPDAEVYRWIDSVRTRAGLKGVVAAWRDHAILGTKPSRKDGMREIIKRERLIELSFEGHRLFDLLRWKDAMKYLSEPVQGWNQNGVLLNDYYRVTTYWDQRVFNSRDYFWPIKLSTLRVNVNLVQSPGW